jgi:2-polyprenyl-6-methoxyphenol hydroxylase-like FAD-dependent oxidoreductase
MTASKAITIVGGGVAGLSLGIFLRRQGIPCTVLEAGKYPRHKVCGEFFSPRDPYFLTQSGMDRFFQDAEFARSVAWFWPGGVRSDFSLPHPARTLSRYDLDAALADAFLTLGGVLRSGERADIRQAVAGQGCVIAAGRERAAGATRWVGIKAHYTGLKPVADLEMHGGPGGYVGMCALSGGTLNVSGLFRAELLTQAGDTPRKELLPALLAAAGLRDFSRRLRENAALVPGSFCSVSHLDFHARSGERNGLRIGDAFAVIPPLTGNGMSLAMESAWIVCEPLRIYATGAMDWETTVRTSRAALEKHFRSRLFRARLCQMLLLSPFTSRAASLLARTGFFPWAKLYRALGQ